MTILPKKNDVLFAHKALNLLPGLSVAGRRVASALIDHCNREVLSRAEPQATRSTFHWII